MAVTWTPQQQEVIQSKNCNLLVSAAAGSGKTAVLVERIIQMLTREENPVGIDRLLVVTFTRAAAAEMRERIGKGIDKKLAEHPDSRHLRHQKLILGSAQISTIHSLCKTLIQENYEALEIDPSFRMAEENELKILQHDVAEDMMEGYYASGNQQFRAFVDRYASKRADEGIVDMILETYRFSRGLAAPELWLDSCADLFAAKEEGGRISLPDYLAACTREVIFSAIGLLEQAKQMIYLPGGPLPYESAVLSDLAYLRPLTEMTDYEQLRQALRAYKAETLSRKKGEDEDSVLRDQVRNLRNQAKGALQEFIKDFLKESSQELALETGYLRESIRMLTELVKDFTGRFQQEKADRNIMDFSDLEHETLRLLAHFSNEDGRLVVAPAEAADRIAACYDEVICDEYQDSNQVQEVILQLISGIRSGRNNRFMVGDVKQSIYRFRQADASIFMNKAEEYEKDGSSSRRINLNQNFRSRIHILRGINLVFGRLMQKETCGITYDEREALHRDPDTLFPAAPGRRIAVKSDVLLVEMDQRLAAEEDISKDDLEAAAVAEKILEITDPETGMDVFDKDLGPDGDYRKACFRDIAILCRSLGEYADRLVRALGARGIPVSAQITRGFFETVEIRTMTALLSLIDNPEQDIAAAAVLRAPFTGLSSEELAGLRTSCPDGSLIRACRECPPDAPWYCKVRLFLDRLDLFRRAADYMEMDEFIRFLYEQTDYYALVQAMPSGLRRQANLDLLLENAVSFTQGSLCGLFSFVRYLEQIRKNKLDIGEASADTGDGSVRIMTIHKSKGLEFPVVILAGTARSFNWDDLKGTLLLHRELGIGLDIVDLKARKKLRSASKRIIARQLKQETLAEEMRVLYVAMTRAKEKLIMTGCVDQLQKKMDRWEMLLRSGTNAASIFSAGNYLDWIMPAVIGPGGADWFETEHVSAADLLGRLVSQVALDRAEEETLRQKAEDGADTFPEMVRELNADAAWTYPWEMYGKIKGKYSVSELKAQHAGTEEEKVFPPSAEESSRPLPIFMQEESGGKEETAFLTGALRGTAFHRVMELLDFASVPEESARPAWLKDQITKMTEDGQLTAEQAKSVYRTGILRFLKSDLAGRMCRAAVREDLHKESQFVMSVPASMIDPELTGSEEVLVQGIVDAWFEENGHIIIMDYKTDKVSEEGGEEILRACYARQLAYYGQALSAATGMEIGEKWIYSFRLDRQIPV